MASRRNAASVTVNEEDVQSNQSGQTRENRKNYSGDRKDEKSKKTFMDALQLKTIMKGPSEKAALSDVVRYHSILFLFD